MQAVLDEVETIDTDQARPPRAARAVANVSDDVRYAPLWRRVLACLIDGAIVLAMVLPSAVILTWLMEALHSDLRMKIHHARYLAGIGTVALWVIGDWIYNAKMISSRWQATVGKRALGIRVLNAEKCPACFGQISARHFAKFLSTFSLGAGFLMASLNKHHQALHDIVSDTIVVLRKRA